MKNIGRNDPCACGSGRKYKNCCLGKTTSQASIPPSERPSIPTDLQQAIEHHRLGRLDQAEAIYQKILGQEPNHADALHLSGVIFSQRGNNELAVAYINKAIAANPSEPAYYHHLGNALKESGQLDDAVVSYRKALSIKPDFAEACNSLGNAFEKRGVPDEAVACYRQALAIKPDFAEAHNNLGFALEAQGKLDEAIAAYDHALAIRPDMAEAHNNLGNAFEKQGKLDEAATCYSQALTVKSDFAEPYLNLGSMLISTGRVPAARTLLEIGLASVVKGGWRVASLALIPYWILGLYGEARALVNSHFAAVFSDVPNRQELRQKVFFAYIEKLLEQREARPSLYATEQNAAPLIVLGDSHSLSPANTTFEWHGARVAASSRLISGIKMFHLGESMNKQYSIYLSTHLRAINPASHLLFTIGEIDCRPGEGIWKACRKKGRSVSDIVARSVDGYLNCIANQIADRQFASVTVQGIPAPAYALTGEFDPGDKPAFLAMINAVNVQLKAGVLSRGWQFLDVHAATVGFDGLSNGKWHLDEFHLLPAFYGEAMQWMH
jgi:tetratricopeptide (TPR) repeat protein